MQPVSGSSTHIAQQLENLTGCKFRPEVNELLLKAAKMLRKQQEAIEMLVKAADKSASLRLKAEQELQEYKEFNSKDKYANRN